MPGTRPQRSHFRDKACLPFGPLEPALCEEITGELGQRVGTVRLALLEPALDEKLCPQEQQQAQAQDGSKRVLRQSGEVQPGLAADAAGQQIGRQV